MRRQRLFLLSLCLLLLSSASLHAQTVLTLEDLFNMPGKNISKGSNTTPVGTAGVKSYHLDELTLTAPVVIDGQTINATKAYRLSITGGPFPVRSQVAVISVNGNDLKNARESADLSEITAITFDDSFLTTGSTISLSWGEETTVLPEKLTGKNK